MVTLSSSSVVAPNFALSEGLSRLLKLANVFSNPSGRGSGVIGVMLVARRAKFIHCDDAGLR